MLKPLRQDTKTQTYASHKQCPFNSLLGFLVSTVRMCGNKSAIIRCQCEVSFCDLFGLALSCLVNRFTLSSAIFNPVQDGSVLGFLARGCIVVGLAHQLDLYFEYDLTLVVVYTPKAI